MSVDYRYFPVLSIPGGTTGQVLTKSSNDLDNGAQWSNPQGTKFTLGTGVPTLSGTAGDIYVDIRSGKFYRCLTGVSWVNQQFFVPITGVRSNSVDVPLDNVASTFVQIPQRADSWAIGNVFEFHITGNIGTAASITVRVYIGPAGDPALDPIALDWVASPSASGPLEITGQFGTQAIGTTAKVRGICRVTCGTSTSALAINSSPTFDSTISDTFVSICLLTNISSPSTNKLISGKLTARDI